MISQTVEYALRAIVTIAQHAGAPCTAQKISAITQVPAPYLSKMMQGLVRANLVTSKRGLHGGFVLTNDPSELTILQVIDAVEPFKRIRQCPLQIDSHSGTLCPLHRRLDNAMEMVENSFRKTTVADLLGQPGNVTPLCEKDKVTTISLDNEADESKKESTTKRKKGKQDKG